MREFGVVSMVLALVLCGVVSGERDTDVCRIFPNNTIIRDPDSCHRYITCIDFVSHYKSCSGSTPFFDKNTQKCVKTTSDDSNCNISCANKGGLFISDPKSCYGYYYCADEETPLPGTCPATTHFNETTQTCTQKFDSNCKADDFEYCSIVKDGVKFNDERRCDAYFTCSKGVLKHEKCKDMYFDVLTGKCISKSLVNCNEHPVPDEACGKASKPKKNVFISDSATCSGYFYCAEQADGTPDQNPRWGQCPIDKFFDASTQTCKDPIHVKCQWDRCENRSKSLVLSGTVGCRHYLQCVNGVTYAEVSCGNYFFNEEYGVCGTAVATYPACK